MNPLKITEKESRLFTNAADDGDHCAGGPGDPLVVTGRVFVPDGEHTVAGVVVHAYNTDKDGCYSPDGKVGHPRLKGYMKTDAEGRFELHTIRPGRYPGMHIPAHVHFNLRARAIQCNGRRNCGSRAIRI
jgi:protocatechuate 3,4-dioxygenase beta subunit